MTEHRPPTKLFCFGFGYCACTLAARLARPESELGPITIAGTQRTPAHTEPAPVQVVPFEGTSRAAPVTAALAGATHVLLSVPPDASGDPALRWHAADLAALPSLVWIGYLSTIGVYGDAGGAVVTEQTPTNPSSDRGRRRVLAEDQWRQFGQTHQKRVEIFRLPGIYGPGRSAIDTVRNGTARRIVKPGQVFNRIHVTDIAAVLERAMARAQANVSALFDIFNVTDDEPAPPQDVIAYAAGLLSVPVPPEIPFDAATLSPMAQSFYAENKRASNAHLKATLGITLTYPTYHAGLAGIRRNLG